MTTLLHRRPGRRARLFCMQGPCAGEEWRYRLDVPERIYVGAIAGIRCGAFATRWGSYRDGLLTVADGYAWDGCSGRVGFVQASDGPPGEDGKPQMWLPSLVHDWLYQHGEAMAAEWGIQWDSRLPWVRAFRPWADQVFYRLALAKGFKYARTYYRIVRWLGGVYHLLNTIGKGAE